MGPRANPDAFGDEKISWELNFCNMAKLLDTFKKPQQHFYHIKEWTALSLPGLIIHSTLHNNLFEIYKLSFNANLILLSIHSCNIKIKEDKSKNTDTLIALGPFTHYHFPIQSYYKLSTQFQFILNKLAVLWKL
jgi:hypothetical protein